MIWLPNELWHKIFDEIPLKDVLRASATSKGLRSLALPIIWRKVYFSPKNDADDQHPQRLEFLCSEDIAPLVRELEVYSPSLKASGPCLLLLDNLHRFTRLRRLALQGIDPSDKICRSIASHPSIAEFSLIWMSFGALSNKSPKWQASNTNLTHICVITSSPLSAPLLQLIYAPSLERLDLIGVGARFDAWAALKSSVAGPSAYAALKTVSVFVPQHQVLAALASLGAMPNVEDFSISASDNDEDYHSFAFTCEQGYFPRLSKLECSHNLLPILVGGERLKHLEIMSCTVAELTSSAQRLGALPSTLVSIALTLNLTQVGLVAARLAMLDLWDRFPSVTELRLSSSHVLRDSRDAAVRNAYEHGQKFFDELSAHVDVLPPTLTKFEAVWSLDDITPKKADTAEQLSQPVFSTPRRFLDALLVRCPNLTSVLFNGSTTVFSWTSAAGNEELIEIRGFEEVKNYLTSIRHRP
ncbi:hypothetical protein HMN09_00582300 [Mycena chlorophos]|uniref:F-box domain-containing protein n=1 Tax=Mycena chlorophos TaxID=658473 RepID=A0A8H6T3N2_MYCCL|nr:hypothetical protein HMN09_00582300 [Mycena chlorophos]